MWNGGPAESAGDSVKRRFFGFISALSLLLCAATVVLWVRSYRIHDIWTWGNYGAVQLHLVSGEVELYWGVPNPGNRPLGSSIAFIWQRMQQFWSEIHRPISQFPDYGLSPTMTVHWNFAGFISAEHDPRRVNQSPLYHVLAFPYWIVVAVEFCITASFVRSSGRLRRAARLKVSGLCPRCGYDLRASPVRCPECGTIVPKKTEAAA